MSEVVASIRRRKVQISVVVAVLVVIIIIMSFSSLKLDGFSIQGVKLGDSYDKIEKKLGVAQDKFSGRRYTYDGVEFSADDSGKIDNIRIWGTDYRTDKKLGVGSTLAEIVDQYGKDKLRMTYGDVYVRLNKIQMIMFNMAAYDSSDLYDTTIVKSMEVRSLGDRYRDSWDSMSPLEFQPES
ncbi:hypothetical protein [Paenibacillus chungangensis]|uniref:DUF4825 domain-containing protein n=1 Tax=Paenibacillus chungangensis TaxID=696535 RepID=A0ABW3HKI7_9BACL